MARNFISLFVKSLCSFYNCIVFILEVILEENFIGDKELEAESENYCYKKICFINFNKIDICLLCSLLLKCCTSDELDLVYDSKLQE